MLKHNEEICESLDAAIFTGCDFTVCYKENLLQLRDYLDRWKHAVDKKLQDIEDEERSKYYEKLEKERG